MAVLRPTTCKEAIARWEKAKEQNAADALVVELQFQWPPIDKMDGALSTLIACEKLSLSTNMIEKIAGIAGMRNLKILSLGRNNIKSLSGIEAKYVHKYDRQDRRDRWDEELEDIVARKELYKSAVWNSFVNRKLFQETVADSLEELWISYNPIDKMKGIGSLKNLRVLYMSNNLIKEWVEFNRLQECPALRDLVFTGNPIQESQPDIDTWRTQAATRLQQITKLDGIPVIRE